ncbi:MAG: flagellar protein FlaG [Lachnospiraceae bacterium]|jgi:flagellar protein FlaG|nr:flagellar protein FlaG [Lachnospiraceae bacterium]
MTLEPISSAMTYQAQTQAPRASESAPKVNTDVTPDAPKMVDTKTVYVKESRMKDDENGGRENEAQQRQPSNENIKKAVENLASKIGNSEAIFGIHEKTNRVTIKIVDKDTKEVIREFPPEKTLDMIAKAWELAGIMVDEKR